TLPFEPLLRQLGAEAARIGVEAYAVGGAVRDALLGRETTDLDVVSVGPGSGIALAEAIAEAMNGKLAVYPSFGTAAVTLQHAGETLVVEFVGARRESYRGDSRKPIVEDGTLDEDLSRRDFTVNALAVQLHPEGFGMILDRFDGLADLQARRLRTPLDPDVTFEDDPLRMLRGARFASQLGFTVVPEAQEAMRRQAARIEIVSQERITDELTKTLASPMPSTGFRLLYETGVLEHVLPELTRLAGVERVGGDGHKDNFYHTLEVVDNLVHLQRGEGVERPEGRDLWLRWAALFHDLAKADTKRYEPGRGWTFHGHEDRGARKNVPEVFRRLRLPLGEALRYTRDMVRLHHRPTALVDDEVSDSAIRRLLVDAGDAIDDLMLLVRADVTSKNAKRARRYLRGFDRVEAKMREVEERDRLREFQPPVDGLEIMEALELEEGVAVGILKAWVREAVLEGEVPNEHDPAWAYVLDNKDDALRRGRLWDAIVPHLQGRERAATGAIKEALFWDDLPDDDEGAVRQLEQVKADALKERFGSEAK
ncbi:MAG: CCA tRNA nucleotidyltransferase, partial [Bacteroidota bacterium]